MMLHRLGITYFDSESRSCLRTLSGLYFEFVESNLEQHPLKSVSHNTAPEYGVELFFNHACCSA